MKLLDTQANTCPDFSTSLELTKSSTEGVEIKPMDVLCGRGKNSFNHVGNRKFRDIVAEAIPGYVTASSRATKSEIVTSIVRQVQENGGRFLKQDTSRKVWYVLNYTQSKEKAGHAIRDATITEESKKQRARKRKLMRAAAASQNSPRKCVSPDTVVVPSVVEKENTPAPTPTPPTQDNTTDDNSTVTTTTKESKKTRKQLDPPGTKDEFQVMSLTDLTKDIMAMDDDHQTSTMECLSNMLMAHFPEKLLPEDNLCSSAFEPLPLDDPFNSYIDQLLGPLTGF